MDAFRAFPVHVVLLLGVAFSPAVAVRAQLVAQEPQKSPTPVSDADDEMMFLQAERVKNTNTLSNQRDEGTGQGNETAPGPGGPLGVAAPPFGGPAGGGGGGGGGSGGGPNPDGGGPEPPDKEGPPHVTPEPGTLLLAGMGLPLLLLLRRNRKSRNTA